MFWLYIILGIVAGAAIGSFIKKLQKPEDACSCGCGGGNGGGSATPAADSATQEKDSGCPFCHPLILGALVGGVAGAMIAGLVGKNVAQNVRTSIETNIAPEEKAAKKTPAVSRLIPTTLAEFNDKTAKGIVLVDFNAEWCGPCKVQKPILEEFAAEMGDQVRILSVNIDEQPELAQKFGIQSIPAIGFFREGKLIGGRTGLQTKDFLHRAYKQVKELPAEPEAPATPAQPAAEKAPAAPVAPAAAAVPAPATKPVPATTTPAATK